MVGQGKRVANSGGRRSTAHAHDPTFTYLKVGAVVLLVGEANGDPLVRLIHRRDRRRVHAWGDDLPHLEQGRPLAVGVGLGMAGGEDLEAEDPDEESQHHEHESGDHGERLDTLLEAVLGDEVQHVTAINV